MAIPDIQSHLPALLAAMIAGGAIGLEREWRGRAAGFRTHILVCLASALLMRAALVQGDWAISASPTVEIVTDPTRMAHGILTGIGFLCAGVIFRTGFSVHGLTTAASLWITSAIGILFGVGLFGLGALGAIVTGVILVALRLINLRLPARTMIDAEVCWRNDPPGGRDGPGADTEAAVEAALAGVTGQVSPDRFELIEDGRVRLRSWRLSVRGEADLKSLAAALSALPGVCRFRLDVRDD